MKLYSFNMFLNYIFSADRIGWVVTPIQDFGYWQRKLESYYASDIISVLSKLYHVEGGQVQSYNMPLSRLQSWLSTLEGRQYWSVASPRHESLYPW